jgi:hypothetical protein
VEFSPGEFDSSRGQVIHRSSAPGGGQVGDGGGIVGAHRPRRERIFAAPRDAIGARTSWRDFVSAIGKGGAVVREAALPCGLRSNGGRVDQL